MGCKAFPLQEVLEVLEADDQTQLFETWEYWVLFMINTVMLNVAHWFCNKGLIVKLLKCRGLVLYLMFQLSL